MKKIGVYYICTGVYKNWFAGFLESLTNFLPEDEKNVFIISDGLDEYVGYESPDTKVKVKKLDHIHYYPWPIVTLFKFKYILDNKDTEMDYCFYFNANSFVLQKSDTFWSNFTRLMEAYSLITTYHAVNAQRKCKEKFVKGSTIRNRKSTSFIKSQDYYLLQAAFFGGKTYDVYQMCQSHLDLLTEDLKNNIIAPVADESYFNKYIFENLNNLPICRQMIIFAEEKGYQAQYEDEIFVKLRYNDNYKDKKSDKDPRNIIARVLSRVRRIIMQ